MTKTISISLKNILLFIPAILILAQNAYSSKISTTASCVPADSFLVLSVNIDKVVKKSKIQSNQLWKPLFNSWNLANLQFKKIFLQPEEIGINSKIPLQLFLNTSISKSNPLSFGIISQIKSTEKFDQKIANLAESLEFSRKNSKSNRFCKNGYPLEFGRKGRLFYVVGFGPALQKTNTSEIEMDKLYQAISSKSNEEQFPSSLQMHFSQHADVSLYLDGSGIANVTENSWPDDRWKQLLPILDPFFTKQFGLYIQSNLGSFKVSSQEFHFDKKVNPPHQNIHHLLDLVPGDSPLVARISMPAKDTKKEISRIIDQILRTLSNNQITKDTKLPGFDATPSDLLSFPNGELIFSGGHFGQKYSYSSNGSPIISLKPIINLGIGIDQQLGLKQLIAGLNSMNSLQSILQANDLHLTDHGDSFWISSLEYLREIKNKKPIKALSKKRKSFLSSRLFGLDLNINQANYSVRQSPSLTFEQLKMLHILDDFKNLSIYDEENKLVSLLKLNDSNRTGWEVLFHHIGQSLIDQVNHDIFQAISQNNLNSTIQAVKRGALLNATDRFGHSPMHYASYKGNPRIVEYLLRSGGDPNTKGRHKSTPLHSAAWGRNIQVLELLLEEGANVNARTDEGETPCMTAALRGEKDILEILFSLSADPHVKDNHGTNLIDLAAAGGHKSIVELLTEIGVMNQNPLHVAAGLGDLNEIKRLLNKGIPVNARDAFGATPLLIAMVSGKEDVIDFLLSKKANPHISAKDGYTIIHGAAFSGKKSLVQKALSYNFDVNSRYGPDGITPVDVAEETGDALPFLRSLGGKTAWELGRVIPQSR